MRCYDSSSVRPQIPRLMEKPRHISPRAKEENIMWNWKKRWIPNLLAVNDPITGVDVVLFDKHGPGALEPKELTSPREMTPKQRAKHNLTHLPMDPGCAICRACRSPNTFHLPSHEHERVIPLVV